MSSIRPPVRLAATRPSGRRGRLIPIFVIAIVVLVAFFTMASVWTSKLWFDTLGAGQVFSTSLLTRIGLFGLGAALTFVVLAGTAFLAWRSRPAAGGGWNPMVDRYRAGLDSHRKLALIAPVAIVAIFAGASASSHWQPYLAWRNRTPFGTTDPQFHRDAAFYVFTYPFLRYLLSFAFVLVVFAIIIALIAHLAYGGIRPTGPNRRSTAAAHIHLAILLGVFCALKAVQYYLDRFGLMLDDHKLSGSSFSFTGLTYTGAHAELPGRTILMVIAIGTAVLFFANAVRRTWLLPGLGLAILAVTAVLFGWLWPTLIQQFQVRPNEPDRESTYIQRNIGATRDSYALAGVDVQPYAAKTTATAGQLKNDAESVPGIRLMDPNLVAESFEQLQQIRGFYSFPSVLDVDRYTINGTSQDAVVAAREVSLEGLPSQQRNWNNDHTVFTHGYGGVAAYGNRAAANGAPVWMERDLPSTGDLGEYQQRIYFGEQSPDYSIVGRPPGAAPIELDVPGDTGDGQSAYVYTGKGGVGIGSPWRRALYGAKFTDLNILLSQRITGDSKILYDRHPADRVAKVAPWLTLDSDAYPSVVDGRVLWIIDGYTTSDSYPNSQRVQLGTATSDTLTAQRGGPASTAGVTYMRNSIKATVDAYDGSVTLYQWDDADPVVATWSKVFPGLVQPKASMSKALMAHVRYPEDLFKVQRELLGQYHVTDPKTFYEGTERWTVPNDPTKAIRDAQPPYYLSVKMPGQSEPHFSLTSTYIPVNKQNLAAFVAVNSDATSNEYGKMRVLQLNGTTQVNGPGQAAQSMQTDQQVRETLLALQGAQGSSSQTQAVAGNLLTLPMGGGLLYVQPYYAQRQGSNVGSYPLLRLVIVQFGDKVASGASLQTALDSLFSGNSGAETDEPGGTKKPPTPTVGDAEVRRQLDLAASAFADADKALKAGDLTGYAEAMEEARKAVDAARSAEGGSTAPPGATPTPTPEPQP
jgi:uncharacterized protein